jgi:hypothetical protein
LKYGSIRLHQSASFIVPVERLQVVVVGAVGIVDLVPLALPDLSPLVEEGLAQGHAVRRERGRVDLTVVGGLGSHPSWCFQSVVKPVMSPLGARTNTRTSPSSVVLGVIDPELWV